LGLPISGNQNKMAKTILIKPIITEKAERLSETNNQYSFVVDRRANKIEIKLAVEDMYSVNVASVNTMVMPAKAKSRNTRSGVIKGHVSSYKKAIVKLVDGEEIDFFGDI
jgi:large subunit ribosomal protein L23